MLLTKREPVSDVFTYKKGKLNFYEIKSECSTKITNDINEHLYKTNIIKAIICAKILNQLT